MELRLLQYFLAVAGEGTISGAAEVLHITQPTLSRQMLELEKIMGKKLFIRGNRRITLTDDGIRLKKRAKDIIELVQKTETEFLASDNVFSGDVYIGGGETFAMRLIAEVIRDIQMEYPDIHFHIFSGNADDVTERLDKGLLDFGILIEPANLTKYDSVRLPSVDTWGVLMHRESPLVSKTCIQPKDLWNLPLISSRQSLVSKEISTWIKKDYEKLNVVATYNLLYNASLLVEEGVGYALCLDKLVNTTGESKLCFRPLEPKLEARLDIVWKKHQVFSKAANVFVGKIKELFLQNK